MLATREEETRLHCLSNCVSSPTAAITLSMMSCGISIDFAIRASVTAKIAVHARSCMTRIHSREHLVIQ